MSAETTCHSDQQTTLAITPRSSKYAAVTLFAGSGPVLFSFGCSGASVLAPLS